MEKEFKADEATKIRTSNLEKLYDAITAIPQTSVTAEKAFSAAGFFIVVIKIRSRMNDDLLDQLKNLKSCEIFSLGTRLKKRKCGRGKGRNGMAHLVSLISSFKMQGRMMA